MRPPLSSVRAMSISTNQLKSGNHVEVDGTIYKVVEFQHVNPGKGAAFVRTKLRRASDGAVIDKTFRAGEKLRSVRSEGRNMQFLYADADGAHFMNTETYEQIALPNDALGDTLKWIKAGDQVDVLFLDDRPSDVQLPTAVDLQVAETEPGLRGDTASGGGTKPATLETGVVVQVPLFISEGETIRVDTREGRYLSRA
jgi:elongation factor P